MYETRVVGGSLKDPALIRVFADVGKNRLVMELSGTPTPEQAVVAENDLGSALPRLRSPIDFLSDVSQLTSLELSPPGTFERLGGALNSVGVRRVVRVVGRSTEGALQMQRVMRFFGHSAHLAFSRDEADMVLSQR